MRETIMALFVIGALYAAYRQLLITWQDPEILTESKCVHHADDGTIYIHYDEALYRRAQARRQKCSK